jgi:multidrug efflux system membrane fusion protein
VSVVRLQPISVVFTAPEETVVEITKALAAGDVPVDAMSSDGTRTLSKGKLLLLNNQVDQASGTIQMKARYTNEDDALWPGLSVSTRLLLRTDRDAIIVPQTAIQHGPDGLFVYVVGDDNKAKKQDVKVSEQNLAEALVTDGLAAGQKVIVAGQSRVQEGVLVKPIAPQGNAASPAAAKAPAKAAGKMAEDAPAPQTPAKKP